MITTTQEAPKAEHVHKGLWVIPYCCTAKPVYPVEVGGVLI